MWDSFAIWFDRKYIGKEELVKRENNINNSSNNHNNHSVEKYNKKNMYGRNNTDRVQ